MARFPGKVKKPSKMAHFWNYWMIRIFFGKSGRVTFLHLSSTIFMQKIRKIQDAVTEICGDGRTDRHFGAITSTKVENCSLQWLAMVSTLDFTLLQFTLLCFALDFLVSLDTCLTPLGPMLIRSSWAFQSLAPWGSLHEIWTYWSYTHFQSKTDLCVRLRGPSWIFVTLFEVI